MSNAVLRCQKLGKIFHDGDKPLRILDNIDFHLNTGERVAIVGPSGSGKSTLLHLLGGLDKPSFGDVFLFEQRLNTVSEAKRCALRNQYLGFVYQFHHLLPEFNALENVAMPLLLAGIAYEAAYAKAYDCLSDVGLAGRASHRPAALSGGERQRVAIARAIVHQPACILADEPTGNLDSNTALQVFDCMMALHAKQQTAFVVVTHDQNLASKMDRILTFRDGTLKALA